MEQSKTSIVSRSRLMEQEENCCLKHQLKCFFNYILLGHWELARSIAGLILQGPIQEDRKRVLTALADIATNPYDQCIGSASVRTPEHLSWLALVEFHRHIKLEPLVGLDLLALKQDVEFRLLLVLEFKNMDENTLHDAYQYFQKHHGLGQAYSRVAVFDTGESLPHSVVSLVRHTLRERPHAGHHLVTTLMPKQRVTDSKESEALQGMYVQSINALLDKLTSNEAETEPDRDKQRLNKTETERRTTLDKIWQLLSLYNPQPYWNYLQIRQLFTRLISLCRSNSTEFSIERVMEALTGRSHGYLMEEFCKIHHELDVVSTPQYLRGLPEEQRLPHLLTGEKESSDNNWQRYFTACLKWNKHFLGLIVESCLSLAMGEQFEVLGQLLCQGELQRLRPVVLLASWPFCKSSVSARRLLDSLWTLPAPKTHPALAAGCQKLAYQLSLIKWCLDHARPLLEGCEPAGGQGALSRERATRMLHGLETHSVLFVLHRSTRLATLNPNEVLQLLHNVAHGNVAVSDHEKKKLKSVRFQDNDSQGFKEGSCEPASMEQEHDICIYRSYCAVKNVMDALVFCYKHAYLDLMNPIVVKQNSKPKTLHKVVTMDSVPNLSSSEGDESSTPRSDIGDGETTKQATISSTQVRGERFEELYSKAVWQRLQQARQHLQHVHPLTYRLEVMENIFSLLFCRHADLRDDTVLGEGESDEDVEGESMETPLNRSLASEEDPVDGERFVGGGKDTAQCCTGSSAFAVAAKDNLLGPSSCQSTNSASVLQSCDDRSKRVKLVPPLDYDAPFQEAIQDKISTKKLLVSESSDTVLPLTAINTSCGFLANEYVVRDILFMLKEALIDLNTAKFKLYGPSQDSGKTGLQSRKKSDGSSLPQSEQGRYSETSQGLSTADSCGKSPFPVSETASGELEKLLSSTVRTSISQEVVQKRIAQLTQHVHETQWRFQLVAHEQFPRLPGKVLQELVIVNDDDTNMIPAADNSMMYSSPSVTDGVPAQVRRGSCRRQSLGMLSSNTNAMVHSSQLSIVSRMLSSPESLLTLCLIKDNLPQATQVIKLLKISERTREAAELSFTERLHAITKSLLGLDTVSPRDTVYSPSASVRFSLQAVKNAAAAGLANANLSSSIDDLLACPAIPSLPRPQWLVEGKGEKGQYSELFNVELVLAVLLDLACTMCPTWDLCSSVFSIIKARAATAGLLGKNCSADVYDTDSREMAFSSSASKKSKVKASKQPWKVRGCLEVFQQFDSLLQLGHSTPERWTAAAAHEPCHVTEGASRTTQVSDASLRENVANKVHLTLDLVPDVLPSPQGIASPPTIQHSFMQHFRCSSTSLQASVAKQYETSIRELQQSFEQANQALLGLSLEREDSFTIDESHFAKSPLPKQSPSSSLSHSACASGISSMGSGASSIASKEVTPGKVQEPLLHRRMKQLIATIEKNVPHDGLVKLLIHGRLGPGLLRNYLLSTYQHVKELALLVADTDSKSAETLILPKNYFSVLQEGPVDILGRLVFVKRVAPVKLEKVAQQLSLNLTHIIVQSCCPNIPSRQLSPVPARYFQNIEKVGPQSIHNSGNCTQTQCSDPEMCVRIILTDVLKTMHDISEKYNGRSIFTEVCGRQLVKSDSYRTLLAALPALQSLDLQLLDSGEKKLSFFSNLLNLMTLHFHLHNIALFLEAEASCSVQSGGEDTSWDLKCLDSFSLVDRVTRMGSFCYRVGQLGILSLYDLKNILLHQEENKGQNLDPGDPMTVFLPPVEPRLRFIVSDCCLASPPLQVLESSSLSSQLEAAARVYTARNVQQHSNADKVSDAATKEREDGDNNLSQRSESLQNGQSFMAGFAYNLSLECNAEPVHLHKAEAEATKFPKPPEPSQQGSHNHSFSGSLTSSFLPQHFLLESCSSLSDGKVSMTEPASYKVTPATLDYVRETSGLVATLLTLLCADELDEEEDELNADRLTSRSLSRHRASSDISVVDMRSYRYHRLVDDFPILQRHLLTYIIPLAGADNPEISNSGEPILKFVTNVINDDVKLCLFSLHNSVQFLGMLHTMMTRLITQQQWQPLVHVLRSIPEPVVRCYPHLQLLHDFVVGCWVKELSTTLSRVRTPGSSTFSASPGKVSHLYQLRRMYCHQTQARTVLAVCHGLPVDLGMDLLELCLMHTALPPTLVAALKAKLDYLTVYHRIISCIKTQQIRLAMQQADILNVGASSSLSATKEVLQRLGRYEDWRQMARMARQDPTEVFNILLQAGDFVVLRDWARLHNLPHHMIMEAEVWYLKSLLTSEPLDLKPPYQALEELRRCRPGDCLEVCQLLLNKLQDHRHVLFLTNFMLHSLTANLPPDHLQHLRLTGIGAKALLCIPRSMRGEYAHLITCPHLILEQLLMNTKADLASQVFEKIHSDFEAMRESKVSVTQELFNSLLSDYARKALEVTVVQAVDQRSTLLGSPRPESSGSGSSRDEGRTTPLQRAVLDATKVRRPGFETQVSLAARLSSTPVSLNSHQRGSAGSAAIASTAGVYGSDSVTHRTSSMSKFIMPALAPDPEDWIPDSQASVCMVCKLERFSMFSRRHHCRRCGRVVCGACSTKRSQVHGVLARTCDECFEQIFGPSEVRARDEQEVYSQRMKESLSGVSPNPPSPSLAHSPSLRCSDTFIRRSLPSAIHHDVHEWKLSSEEGISANIREEFYYEQAPSVSLCMSMVKHHTEAREGGQLILVMCEELSTYLQPFTPGLTNLEVDYGLVISIIRELLFRAKMIFLKTGDSAMIGKCDAYQARVDLLNMLVKDNYSDLPSLDELSKVDAARCLRDKLVRDQRLGLALEVCTKCGLEATGVWFAWGRACLRAGDFAAARTKLAQCLRVPSDKNAVGMPTRLLMEVIELLESLPSNGTGDIQMLISNPATLLTLATVPVPVQQDETSVESIVYKECTYYLKTYGTYSDYLRFLLRHGYWNKALKFVADHHCSTEVFVDAVLQQTVRDGEMTRLIEQMLMLDASLELWMPYLSATCRYLLKARHFRNLYSIQLVMKDYIRAAMTCITHFYQQGAQSYLDLGQRLQFLHVAMEHMNAFLDPTKWGAMSHPSISPAAVPGKTPPQLVSVGGQTTRLVMSKEDIQRHLRTISLQIEVTQFLQDCLSRSDHGAAAASRYTGQTVTAVPTLFGDQAQRKQLAAMILISGDKFQLSFDLVLRIGGDGQLKLVTILKLAVCELVRGHKLQAVIDLFKFCDQRKMMVDDDWDEVVSTALLEVTDKNLEVKDETEILTKMIRKEQNKINALIMTGKLRSAYLTAAKTNRVQDINRIMAAAERLGQASVRNICKKWLEQHQRN